jgi:DNA-binding SARP family transcriptional activator/Tfp pilus assembly protein PilF
MEATYREGRLVTLARWLDSIDPVSLAGDPTLLIMRGRLHRQEGDFDRALGLYHQARDVYAERGDNRGALEVQIHEALVHHYRGAMEQARDMAEAALNGIGDEAFDPAMRAQAHRIIGEFHHLAGELERAKAEFRRSLSLYEQAGDLYHQSVLLQGLGTTARRMGNPLEAHEHYSRALSILEQLGNRWRIAELQNNIGVGHYYQGEYEQAREIFLQALQEAREVGHLHTEAIVLISLGDLYADLRMVGDAQSHFQAGLESARRTKDVFLEVYCLCALANLYRVDKAWEHAASLLDQAGQLSGGERSGYLQGLVALARGMVAHDQSRLQDARTALGDAIIDLDQAGGQRELTRAYLWHAHTAFLLGDTGEAFAQLGTAIHLARDIKHPHLLVVDASCMIPFLELAKAEAAIDGVEELLVRINQFKRSTARAAMSTASPAVTAPVVEVITFGEAVVKVDGKSIAHTEWKGPLVKELFFYLFENEPVRREVVLDVFWPDYSQAKAQSVFHASLYRMRRLLPKGLISYDNAEGVYLIDKGIDQWYDARAFRELIDRAQAKNDTQALLEQALSIYQGEYLPSIYSDWCLERREMYQRMYVQALTMLAELEMKDKRFDQAAMRYREAVEVEPFQETLHRGLMQALSGAGKHKEALQHYKRLEALLEAEMNLPPAVETRALYDQIRGQVKAAK